MKKYTAGFIGAGNMGGALLKAAARSVGGDMVGFFDISEELCRKREKECGASYLSLEDTVKCCKYVFLGVKPDVISGVLRGAAEFADGETVFVSMAAGVPIEKEAAVLGHERIIRIMPNTPAEIGKGMILYCAGADVTEEEIGGFLTVMSKAGELDRIDEKLIDAASALSGCGPAFVYMFIEALADGAVRCGLPRAKALLYAKQTVLGSAALALASEKHPEQLKDEVCSPGGTTIEGVSALESHAFRGAVADAVAAAFNKTKKL